MYQPIFLGSRTPAVAEVLQECCRKCKRRLVRASAWRKIPWSDRQALKSRYASQGARRLCAGCYELARQDGSALDFERKTMAIDVFAEEYNLMHSSGMTNDHIAERLNMIRQNCRWPADRMSTFNKALQRAREKGLIQ